MCLCALPIHRPGQDTRQRTRCWQRSRRVAKHVTARAPTCAHAGWAGQGQASAEFSHEGPGAPKRLLLGHGLRSTARAPAGGGHRRACVRARGACVCARCGAWRCVCTAPNGRPLALGDSPKLAGGQARSYGPQGRSCYCSTGQGSRRASTPISAFLRPCKALWPTPPHRSHIRMLPQRRMRPHPRSIATYPCSHHFKQSTGRPTLYWGHAHSCTHTCTHTHTRTCMCAYARAHTHFMLANTMSASPGCSCAAGPMWTLSTTALCRAHSARSPASVSATGRLRPCGSGCLHAHHTRVKSAVRVLLLGSSSGHAVLARRVAGVFWRVFWSLPACIQSASTPTCPCACIPHGQPQLRPCGS